jgi:hypothetical protein
MFRGVGVGCVGVGVGVGGRRAAKQARVGVDIIIALGVEQSRRVCEACREACTTSGTTACLFI